MCGEVALERGEQLVLGPWFPELDEFHLCALDLADAAARRVTP